MSREPGWSVEPLIEYFFQVFSTVEISWFVQLENNLAEQRKSVKSIWASVFFYSITQTSFASILIWFVYFGYSRTNYYFRRTVYVYVVVVIQFDLICFPELNESLFAAIQLTNGGILPSTIHNKQNVHNKKEEKERWNCRRTKSYQLYICLLRTILQIRETKTKDYPLL